MIKGFENKIMTKRNIELFFGRNMKGNQYKKRGFYIPEKQKIECICDRCGKEFFKKWEAIRKNLKRNLCNKCVLKERIVRNKRTCTTKEYIARAKKIHGNKYDYSKVIYKPGNKKIIIICRKHREFSQKPFGHLQGQGCPICSSIGSIETRRKSEQKNNFVKRAKKVHGNKYDYSKITPVVYTTQKITIICKIHSSEFLQRSWNHINGQGCPKCARKLVGNKTKKTHDQFIKDAKIKHGNLYDYSKIIYVNNSTKVIIICKKHGEFLQTPGVHLQGNGNGIGCGCPSCNNSNGENKIKNWLEDQNIIFKPQKTFKGCKYIHPLRFDFYLPEKHMCIEYDGEQHFYPISIFGGEKVFNSSKKRDRIKKEYCKNNDISLLRISYKSFKFIEKILKNKFLEKEKI